MALRVWLPLTGTLENKGISNVTVTNNGAIVDSAGKIGSCYSFNGSAWIKITLPSNMTTIQNTSICAWVKSTSSTLALGGISHDTGNTTIGSCTLYSSGWQFSGNGSWTYVSGGTVANTGVWHHVCCTIDDTNIITYLDGVKVTTVTLTSKNAITNLTSSNFIEIGCDHPGGNEFLTGYVNDFRVYDHCLSAAEVREISQGLVLHYKLDDNVQTITNAFNMGSWNTNTASGGFSVWGPSGHSGSRGTNTDRQYIYSPDRSYSYWIAHGANTDTSKYYIFYQSPAFDGGYRSLSCIVKEENSLPIDDTWFMPGWNANVIGEGHAPVSTWTHKYPLGNGFYLCQVDGFYQDGSNDLVCLTVNNGHKVYISEIWLENNRQIASNPLFPSTIIQDCSGYGHNGTIVGDLILNSETKRYSASTKWNSSSPTDNSETGICYIQTPITLTTPLQMSITWWAKPESGYGGNTTHAAVCTSNNASRPTDYNTTAFHHRDSGFDIYPSDGSGVKRLSFTYTKNEWHHYAITYDGTTARSYQNGVEKTSVTVGTNKTLATFSQLYIGYSQAGGARRKTLGSYSDFRIYCTALSAADVKQLYEVSAKVDNLQNLHMFEYKENSSNIFRSELIMPWAKPNTTRRGEIVEHNNTWALNIAPAPFYKNISDSISGALDGMFQTGSYVFDMWIDTDSVIYNGNNVAGGMVIRYTDNSTDNAFVFTGGNKGYQHKIYITPSNKNIQRLEFYYYTSTDVFYRIDSCIYPASNLKINKQGIIQSSGLIEEASTKFIKNDLIETNNLIEL